MVTLRLYRNLWCVVCLFVSGAAAQIRQFEGKQIIDVQYSPASTLDPADLARFQPLKKGEPLRAENVADAIDELFSTGRFTDIAVEAEPSGAGVIVRFVTTGQSFVGGVNIEGKIGTPPNRGELHSNPQFTLGAPFRDEDVTRAVTSLKRLLDSNGLYDATVTPQIERNDNGQQVFITFNIKEGRRAKYEMPAIEGKTLLSNDTILRATGWRIPIIHWWVQVTNARTRKGVVNIQRKYESQDRLTAKVTLDKLDYNSATRRVRPHLTVDPGPKVELKAVEAKVSKRIFKRYVPVYQERTVDTDLLVEGKRNLEDYFQSEGYYDVDIDFRVRPPENDLETIEYVISKGVRHKVAHVAVVGNKYFSTGTIRERMFIAPAAFNLRHGRYSEAFRRKDEANIEDLYKANGFRDVKVATAVEGKRNLEDYFQSEGYYDVDIDFRIRPPENDLETIEYVISKGVRRKVAHVAVAGNKYFSTETIRERMFIAPAAFNLRHGRYSEAFRRKDEANIEDLYKANGFRDVKVAITVQDNFKGKKNDVGVTVSVTEGPQWLVDNIDITGIAQLNKDAVTAELASAAGQPFADVNLATDRNSILTYYFKSGFPAATFKASWQKSATPNHVNVRYEIVEGDRQYVRQVIVSGNRLTRHSLIDRTMTIKAGDPLSPVKETEVQQKFYDLGIFARVDTAIQNPDGATDHKYLLYNFEEANRYTLNVGLGAQIARFGQPSVYSLASPAGATGFSPEVSVDVSRLNFLGLGHTVSLRTLYSSIEKRGSVSYLQPRFMNNDGRGISYTLLYDDTRDVRTFASKREEASVQVSQKFSKSLTGLFRVAYRRVSVGNVVIPVLLVPQFVQPVRIGILSANLVQDRRNNAGNPSRGMYNTIDIGIADRVLGSQRNFGRALVRNATYYKLTAKLILARQTQFGIIAPFSAPNGLTAQESVPLPERFFGGGADSLRAFPYNEAGPRDIGAPLIPGGPSSQATGFPLGGNALFFNNVELRFPLIGENIQGVFFHDMGNVYSSVGNISFRYSRKNLQDFDYTVHAVGFGIRYQTPVGPIRLDLAYSLNPPKFNGFGGTPAQLLTCNPNADPATAPSYCQPSQQSVNHFQFFFSIGQTF